MLRSHMLDANILLLVVTTKISNNYTHAIALEWVSITYRNEVLDDITIEDY